MGSDADDRGDFDDVFEEPWQNQRADDADRPRKPAGRNMVLTILLVIGGGGLFLCCGGCVILSYVMWPSINKNPADVIAATNEMLDIEIPHPFEPGGLLEWDLFSLMTMKVAIYNVADGDGILMLAEPGGPMMKDANAEQQFDRMLDQQGQGSHKLRIQTSERKTFEIDGQNVEFLFSKGTEPKSGDTYRQLTGVVPGKHGPVWLTFQLDEKDYDEQAVTKMIESIGR